MKSISAKLFLAILGLTSLMLVATLLLARWSFDQGFLDYVNSQQQYRLSRMADDLSEYYINNGRQWDDLSSQAYLDIFQKWYPRAGRARRKHRHPLSPPRRGGPPRELRPDEDRPGHFDHDQTKFKHEDRRGNGRDGHRPLEPIALFDTENEPLAGDDELLKGLPILKVDIIVDDEKVGELRTLLRINFSSSNESQFSEQQTRASIIIAVLCLMVAGIASWLLSKTLLAPTLKIRKTLTDLARGDYRSRIDTERNDELGRLMKDTNRLAKTLEKNQQERKRWLADISHELRTPVAILSGEIEAMLDGIRPLNTDRVESLDHEVGRLKHLIDDLYQLSLSDIGGLRYEFEHLDISAHLQRVIAQNRIRIESADLSLSLHIQPGLFIGGDDSRLEQLFTNLINNSIAYTDAPGELLITLKEEGDRVIVCFNDSAPGVSNDKLESVFEPLFRDDSSRSRRVGGAGLGLTISRNIVLAHEGKVDVNLSKLGGLEFVISLPIAN